MFIGPLFIRGFITYYGKHYMAYFYQEGLDQWIKFDDANVIVSSLSCFEFISFF